MILKYTPICEFDKKIIDFSLFDFAKRKFTLDECIGEKGTLIMFLCNHCPYVKAIIKDIVETTDEIRGTLKSDDIDIKKSSKFFSSFSKCL